MKQPKSVIQALFNWNNTKLGAFLAAFVGLYRVSYTGNVMKQPKSVIQALFNWNNTKLGAFLASFVGLYRVS